MALSAEDREWVKLIAQEAGRAAQDGARAIIREVLKEHVKGCPWGKAVSRLKVFALGALAGLLIAGIGVRIWPGVIRAIGIGL
jgi:hypothetical protein